MNSMYGYFYIFSLTQCNYVPYMPYLADSPESWKSLKITEVGMASTGYI